MKKKSETKTSPKMATATKTPKHIGYNNIIGTLDFKGTQKFSRSTTK